MSDVSLNPKSLVVNGAIVNTSNPLPVQYVSPPAYGSNVALSPSSLVVNGAIVNDTNPLPVSVV